MQSFKHLIRDHFDRHAEQRSAYFQRNICYHQQVIDACRQFLNPDSRVLELGCSTGELLAALQPAQGVGVDLSPRSIEQAQARHPCYTWIVGDMEALPDHPALAQPFDLVIVEDSVTYLYDVQVFLQTIKRFMHPGSRLVISSWNWLWQPILRLGERLRIKVPDLDIRENWISTSSLENLLILADYEVLSVQPGVLIPYDLGLLSDVVNSLSYAPLVRRLTLLSLLVARPLYPDPAARRQYSVSVIIPTRNERGNIQALVERTPEMGSHTELIFVDGSSSDGTVEEIHRWMTLRPDRDIRFLAQEEAQDELTPPNLMLKKGKGDAVRKGFSAARGDVLMILDSDISVAPEDMTRFYEVLASGKARFANGTRFTYEFESAAMKPLNKLGNVFFSLAFTWLLGQRITDTLCGTKALFREDYERIAANRAHFGNFDPFGDFDLIFGAAWLGLPMIDVPVRYLARTYGESKVRVSKHGPLLGRMSLIALWHFKIRPLLDGQRRATINPAHAHQPSASSNSASERRAWWLIGMALLLLTLLWRRK
ncbi:MAG: bifunctional class I SAM-dependent methyltransferase/glycosyltransferase family 2 protein [Anaerolineae bacterium]|nr:bifunctional class I SAM-dependent methyltransferase/glycosyltransferase family 2 protein [Anaerolineae bacterium]MDW8171549.1 glycosyltransferase [Anaerolineae bacterium]